MRDSILYTVIIYAVIGAIGLFIYSEYVKPAAEDAYDQGYDSGYWDGYDDGLDNGYDAGRKYVDDAISVLQDAYSLIRSTEEYGGEQKYDDICDSILDDVTDALAWLIKET